MAKKVLLVFAIITIVLGAVSLTIFAIIFSMTLALQSQYSGIYLNPGGQILLFSTLIIGIVLVAVSIVLFIVRAVVK